MVIIDAARNYATALYLEVQSARLQMERTAPDLNSDDDDARMAARVAQKNYTRRKTTYNYQAAIVADLIERYHAQEATIGND